MFQKCRTDYSRNVELIIANGVARAFVAKDDTGTDGDNISTVAMTNSADAKKWHLLVYSLLLVNGDSTSARFWLDTVEKSHGSSTIIADNFIVDDLNYPATIGGKQTASDTYSQILNGFLYEFHLE